MPVRSRTPLSKIIPPNPGLLIDGLLFAAALAAAAVAGPALAADGRNPMPEIQTMPEIQITEVTEASHPFNTLYCARQPIQVRYIGKLAEVVVLGESRMLIQAISASGARYVAPGDDTTELWGKGSFATLTWSGKQLPLCAPLGALIPPYRASGNEPFWSVTYDGWRSSLMRPGEPEVVHEAVIVDTSEQGQTLAAGHGTDGWRLEAHDALCVDDMSGMPHPQRATLHYKSETLHGCGGDPERLLQGVTWHITHIDDQALSNDAHAYIEFLVNNEITGSSGCNRFFGKYALTGETLTSEDLGSTRMACPSSLMAQEKSLFQALASVRGFSFDTADIQRLRLHADGMDVRLQAGPM